MRGTMMRKVFCMIAILVSVCFGLYADDTKMDLNLELPEDYGITFPINGVRLDHFYVSVLNSAGEYALLTEADYDTVAALNSRGELQFTLLYYGNQSKPYTVRISTNPTVDFVGTFDGEMLSIPAKVILTANEDAEDDVEIVSVDDSVMDVLIPSTGARRAEPVADVKILWETREDTRPGAYSSEVVLNLSAL